MRGAIAIVFVSVALAASAEAAAPSAEELKASATRAFRARDYDTASATWRQALTLAPNDAPTWADLGLCEYKRSRMTESLAASRRAVALGDLAVRKAAYFNLALAGADEQAGRPPLNESWVKDQPVRCEELATGECGLKARACVLTETGLGAYGGGRRTWSRLEVCASKGCGSQTLAPKLDEAETCRTPNPWGFCTCAESTSGCLRSDSGEIQMCGVATGQVRECKVVAVDPCRKRAGLVCVEAEGVNDDVFGELRERNRGAAADPRRRSAQAKLRTTVEELALPAETAAPK